MKKVLDQLEEHLIAVLICAMVVFETVNAVFHAAGAAQTGLPEELAIYCYIWIAFLSAAFCAKKGCDVAVNMLSDRYSANVRHLVKIVCAVINLAMSVCLLMGAFQFVTATAAAGNVGKLSGIPMVIVYAASVIGYLLCVFRNAQSLISTIRQPK
ncbi:TRAP transporter small permease [Faecalibacterium prausnitzii]|uniref:TRAP transporter small permease n=1 Tax=Faecalibacterium prausnitzii TaxID=853 RepID=UPI0022E14EA3|nr:TRAP transporter small permease subunit [Faecalibacterium prausnitzii]